MKTLFCLLSLFLTSLYGEEQPMAFTLTSPSFSQGEPIPTVFTCEGKDISPRLVWSEPPHGTQSFVLIVDDPDAPDPKAPKLTWVHWILYNIPSDVRELKEAIRPQELPKGTLEGITDYKNTGYGGPCPPIGVHRYFFKLYALSKPLDDLHAPTKKQLEKAMGGLIIGKAELMGTYTKTK